MLMHPTTSTLFLRFHTGWESPYITDMTSPSATATDGFVPPRESEILGHPSRRPAQVPPPPQVRTPTLRQASPNASPSQVKTEPHHRDAATITRHTPNAVVQLRKKRKERKNRVDGQNAVSATGTQRAPSCVNYTSAHERTSATNQVDSK